MKMLSLNSNHTSSRFYTGGIILVVIIALSLLALIGKQKASLSGEEKSLQSSSQAGRRVNVVKAARAPDERTVTLPGEARSYATVTLYAKVSGYIKEIRVDKGDKVQADQIIAIIESPELTRQYDAAVADAKNKRLDAERALQLFNTGAVSSQSYHGSETTAEIAEKTAASLLAQKEYLTVRAPFSGTITARFVDPGALVQGATTAQTSALPIVTLSETDRLRIYAYPDQKTASLVRVGDRTEISDTARPDVKLTATVSRTSGELDLKTRTLLVEVDCDNRDSLILAGSFVQVTLHLRMPPQVEIPAQALIIRDKDTLVGIITPENKVNLRPVEIYESDGKTVRLSSGVQEGEKVALDLGQNAEEGQHVQPSSKEGPDKGQHGS
jgi:membrane fusion protein, multidrug efflux system